MATRPPAPLALAFYGDDFTGSTDALEWLARAGLRTVLFLEPPAPTTLARYPGLDALGVAGLTRAMDPVTMTAALRPAFAALKALGPAHVHYKVCSTFDSSPTIGSIGRALEIGAEVFEREFIPLLVGVPPLGRHCVFGTLFARMGIGSKGRIHRLDRHPAMSRHPVTPADEADLRLHLARQTSLPCALLDILQLARPLDESRAFLTQAAADGAKVVLIDVLHDDDLTRAGALLAPLGTSANPLFSVGSSAIEMALARQWTPAHALPSPAFPPLAAANGPVIVVSGSCSPVTAAQITWATEHGFVDIPVDTAALLNPGTAAAALANAITPARQALAAGHSVVIHTSRGPDDPRLGATRATLSARDLTPAGGAAFTGECFGHALGAIARTLVAHTSVRRVLVAGGDSSSYAARALGIEAIAMLATFTPGAPLCRAHAPGSPLDGCEIVFKGGQVGGPELFAHFACGPRA